MKSNKNLSELSALSGLPKSWSWVKLGDVCKVKGGYAFKSKNYKKEGIPLVRISNIEDKKISLDDCVYIQTDNEELLKEFLLRKGDILIALSGATTGKYGIYNHDRKAFLNQRIGRLHFNGAEKILPEFVYLYLEIIRSKILQTAYGAAQPNISPSEIADFPIPLPPLPEQKKIVEKIEELFSGLDSGVASLKKAKEQLRLYRQSVLAAAFSGRLLKASRDDIFSIQDSTPKDVISNAHQLPDAWKWVKVRDICKKIIGGGTPSTKVAEYWEGNIDWITSADIYGIKDIRPRKKINTKAIENSATNLLPKGNIVVVTRVGLGKLAINKNDLCFSQDSQGLILNKDIVINTYALWYLSNAVQVFKYKNRGTTINGVTKRQLAELDFILPPKTEQTQIVEEIEKRFSEADNLEKAIDDSLTKAETLRQSILKQAFEGKLV
jgi:type I restriction enzyme S subunit